MKVGLSFPESPNTGKRGSADDLANMDMQILTDDGVVVARSNVRDLDLMAALQDAEVLGQGVG